MHEETKDRGERKVERGRRKGEIKKGRKKGGRRSRRKREDRRERERRMEGDPSVIKLWESFRTQQRKAWVRGYYCTVL